MVTGPPAHGEAAQAANTVPIRCAATSSGTPGPPSCCRLYPTQVLRKNRNGFGMSGGPSQQPPAVLSWPAGGRTATVRQKPRAGDPAPATTSASATGTSRRSIARMLRLFDASGHTSRQPSSGLDRQPIFRPTILLRDALEAEGVGLGDGHQQVGQLAAGVAEGLAHGLQRGGVVGGVVATEGVAHPLAGDAVADLGGAGQLLGQLDGA